MNCGACVSHVTKSLQDVAGVQSADVDLTSGVATVQHDKNTDPARLVGAVTEAGFQANEM